MAKAQIITEDSVSRVKNYLLENIERLDAEMVVLDEEVKQEIMHKHNETKIADISDKWRICNVKRETFHACLFEIQRNITEIEI